MHVCLCFVDVFWCVCVHLDIPPKFPKRFNYLIIKALDCRSFLLLEHFQKAFAFIEEARTSESLYWVFYASTTMLAFVSTLCWCFFCVISSWHTHTHTHTDGSGVLVHCFAGISRSSTIVVAYLMIKNKWSCHKALKYVQSKRSVCKPNPGFLQQLVEFEKRLSSENWLLSLAVCGDVCI